MNWHFKFTWQRMAHRLVNWIIVGSLILLGVALWRRDVLPDSQGLRQELLTEPVQVPTQHAPLETTVGGVRYTIQPLYTYDIYGMVVSKHDADTWWDYLHKEWNDNLNVADLCIVWGKNAHNGLYKDVSFSSGQFTCNFSTGSSEAFAAFDQAEMSNNHLITDDPRIGKAVRSVNVGDQVHFRGYLAEYSHNDGFSFKRGTSIVRTDTDNGACETVYVEDFEILHRGGGPWHWLLKLAVSLLGAGVMAWFFLPRRAVN